MKLSTLERRLTGHYLAGNSLYLVSPPGRGKTDTMTKAPEIIGKALGKDMGLIILSGPLMNPGDTIGYLMPKHLPDGRVESLYSEPFWMRTKKGRHISEYDGGIIFIDEEDKADVDVKKAIGEAKLSGRIGPHHLSGGWVVWGAGNTAKHRSGSTKELDHLINRRMQLEVTDDLQGWLDWADANNVSPLGKAFASQHPDILFTNDVPKEQGPWCTPRSLAKIDSYLQLLAKQNGGEVPDDPETIEETAGAIGAGAAATFFGFVKLQAEMPRYEKIIADPGKAKLPGKPDGQMLVVYALAHRVSKADAAPVIEYVSRLPKEFAVTFAKAACTRDSSLVLTPAFQAWAKDNSSLMAVIAN